MYRRLCLRRDRDARPLIDAMKRSPQAHGAFASLLGADFAVSPHAGNCRFALRPPSPFPNGSGSSGVHCHCRFPTTTDQTCECRGTCVRRAAA